MATTTYDRIAKRAVFHDEGHGFDVSGFDFRYDANLRRFHFGGVLDGSRARDLLGYTPETHVAWPHPWWRELFDRLASDRAFLDGERP